MLSSAAIRLPEPYWVLTVTSGLVVVPIQKQVARINSAQCLPQAEEARFSGLNVACLAFGAVLWALIISMYVLPGAG